MTRSGLGMRFGFTDCTFYVLCRSRELLIHGGREGLSGTRTPSETAAPTSAQSYVGPSHQGVCVCVCVWVGVGGGGGGGGEGRWRKGGSGRGRGEVEGGGGEVGGTT